MYSHVHKPKDNSWSTENDMWSPITTSIKYDEQTKKEENNLCFDKLGSTPSQNFEMAKNY